MQEALTILLERPRANSAVFGLRKTFGRLYAHLDQECPDDVYDPIKNVMRELLIGNMPFGPGDLVLGQILKSGESIQFDRHLFNMGFIPNVCGNNLPQRDFVPMRN